MKTVLALGLAAASIIGMAGTAAARPRGIAVEVPDYVATPHAPGAAAAVSSNIIYLNRCEGGCTFYGGFNEDSRTNTSSVVAGQGFSQATISPFAYGDATWQEVVQCVAERYAPFNVQIVTTEPSGPHFEAVVAGEPGEIALPCDASNGCVGGIAPISCGGIIDNGISFTFSNIWQGSVPDICDTVAQETAHVLQLDHEFLASDPMTYLQFNGTRAFQNINASCGEFSARSCRCGGNTQNSFQMLTGIFGSAAPSPPVVEITEPADGAMVQPGFVVRADVVDPNGIESVSLYIDGAMVGQITTTPYVLNAPASLGDGSHTVEIRAVDGQGTSGSSTINVSQGQPCPATSCGDGLVCVDHRCVTGPGNNGGLGEPCTDHAQCASGWCDQYCVEGCTLEEGSCPSGFECLEVTTGGGACWPAEGDESGGCATGGGSGAPLLPIGLGLALGALFLRRRRAA
jgi:Big-like domain-containing protein